MASLPSSKPANPAAGAGCPDDCATWNRRAFSRLGLLSLLSSTCAALGEEEKFLKPFPLNKKTKFFHFYYMAESRAMDEIMRFADGFVRVVHRQFFTADYEYPIRVLVLEDREKMGAFLRQEFKIEDPPGYGVFIPEFKFFATYVGSGLGTFSHEILHPLVEANLPLHPVWATEGIPTFFEKFYGYWKGEELVLNFGFQNPWRLQGIGDSLRLLSLPQILDYKDTLGRFHESEQRLVAMFMWRQGKFKHMLKLIEKGIPPEGYETWFEAAMGMKVEKITPLWQDYLNDVAAAREVFGLPNSAVLPDEATYLEFAKMHNLDRRQERPLTS
jgi:hypothetical protein